MSRGGDLALLAPRNRSDARPAVADTGTIGGTSRHSHRAVRHVALILDPANLRVVHRELVRRLQRDIGVRVGLVRREASDPLPSSVNLLLRLERMLSRNRGTRLSDELAASDFRLSSAVTGDAVDLIIDFTGQAPTFAPGATLRVAFDGLPGDTVLLGALAAGRMPAVELIDGDAIVGRVVPATDNAGTLLDAYECALARLVDLVVAHVRGWGTRSPNQPSADLPRPNLRALAAFEARALKHTAVRSLYRLCCHAPHWRTCWRWADGPDLWDTRTLAGTAWNVIPDPGRRFYADPFPFIHRGAPYVFAEDFDHRAGKGVISVIPFGERGPSAPARPVLEEPWHLSYPFVFMHRGQVWMIPESSAARRIVLYRADPFPDRWVAEAVLVDDIEASDATLVRHAGAWWMFAAVRGGAGSWSDSLFIFKASDPLGPWSPHAGNPVLIDRSGARPAGALVQRGGRLWRPMQDCTSGYGTGIGLAEVLRLDDDGYAQRVHATLRPEPGWPGRRLHTLNRAGRLECIDGVAHSPRSRMLARRLESWSGRREAVKDISPA